MVIEVYRPQIALWLLMGHFQIEAQSMRIFPFKSEEAELLQKGLVGCTFFRRASTRKGPSGNRVRIPAVPRTDRGAAPCVF